MPKFCADSVVSSWRGYFVAMAIAFSLYSFCGVSNAQTSTIVFNKKCNKTIEKKDAHFVKSHQGPESLSRNFDCKVTVQALKNDQMLYIRLVRPTYYGIVDPDNTVPENGIGDITTCNGSYLAVYDGETTDDPLLLHTCGTTLAPSISTTQNFATFVMHLQRTSSVNFTLLYTSFDYGACTDEATELPCNNGRCIPRTLACERVNNCGDRSDEALGLPSNCTVITTSLTYEDFWWWWIPLAALLLLYILYWCCWRPGYVPWRLSCCRNCWRDMCRDCCKHCCTDCACGKNGKGRGQGDGNGSGRGGHGKDRKGCTCFSCCRSEADEAYLVSETGSGGKGGSKGGRGGKKTSRKKKDRKDKDGKKKQKHQDVVLIDEDGTVRNSNGDVNGGIYGNDFDFSNDDGQHARECR
ncbi:uncharacterized protein [Ptychodera flava]|uniref:uncharacterized protein n=1 Tax=Ptychodera flava TaxID=63121 RepID=UPI00396A03BC